MRKEIYTSFSVPTRPTCVGKNKSVLGVAILASTPGKRMRSHGPKSLYPITTGDSLLEHQAKIINYVYPQSEITTVIGFEADKIIRQRPKTIRIIENTNFENTNEAEDLRLALNNIPYDNIMIILGDILFNHISINNITSESTVVCCDKLDKDEIGVTVVDNYATMFSYVMPQKFSGIIFLNNRELEILRNLVNDRTKNRLFLYELINQILVKGGKIRVCTPEGMEIKKYENSNIK